MLADPGLVAAAGPSRSARGHLQTDAKTFWLNFANVNATNAADDAKLPTTNQTEGTAVTTNSDTEVFRAV